MKTMNWRSGSGSYELEQLYTSYSGQNYSTCRVKYHQFLPEKSGTMFGCGIRKNQKENDYYQKDGTVFTIGDDEIVNPDFESEETLHVEYVGTALVVKEEYKPEYQFVSSRGENHTFRIPVRDDLSYEYLIAGAWSEGSVLKTSDEFKKYILKTTKEYNNPLAAGNMKIERK